MSQAEARRPPPRSLREMLAFQLSGMVGALAQALMLPFLGFAALYLRYRLTLKTLRPGLAWTLLLWVAFASMAAVGLYQFGRQLALWG